MSVRTRHVGKGGQEKEAYKRFLSSKFELDKTVEDKDHHFKSDSSSVEEEETKKVKVTPKSRWLRVKDSLNNNWLISLITGLVLGFFFLLLGGYIDIKSDQGAINEKFETIEGKISVVEAENSNQTDAITDLSEAVSVFKAEVAKDFEFMKERFNFLAR